MEKKAFVVETTIYTRVVVDIPEDGDEYEMEEEAREQAASKIKQGIEERGVDYLIENVTEISDDLDEPYQPEESKEPGAPELSSSFSPAAESPADDSGLTKVEKYLNELRKNRGQPVPKDAKTVYYAEWRAGDIFYRKTGIMVDSPEPLEKMFRAYADLDEKSRSEDTHRIFLYRIERPLINDPFKSVTYTDENGKVRVCGAQKRIMVFELPMDELEIYQKFHEVVEKERAFLKGEN